MKKLTFTLNTTRTLFLHYFDNKYKGSGGTKSQTIPLDATPIEIHEIVCKMQKDEFSKDKIWSNNSQKIYYFYWVTEYEIMTDNRSEFGHANQTSERDMGNSIPVTYTRGVLMSLKKVLELEVLSDDYVEATLSNKVHSILNVFLKDLTEEHLNTKVIVIPGDGERKTFFEIRKEGSFLMNIFNKTEVVN